MKNKEELNSKLGAFEHEPSEKVWDRIEQALKKEEPGALLAVPLAGYEHSPSPKVWEGIDKTLHPGLVIIPMWRWIAAASILLLMTFGGIYLFNKSIEKQNEGSEFVLEKPGNSDEYLIDDEGGGNQNGKEGDKKSTLADKIIRRENPGRQDESLRKNSKLAGQDQLDRKDPFDGKAQRGKQNQVAVQKNRVKEEGSEPTEEESLFMLTPESPLAVSRIETEGINHGWSLAWSVPGKIQLEEKVNNEIADLLPPVQDDNNQNHLNKKSIGWAFEPALAFNTSPVLAQNAGGTLRSYAQNDNQGGVAAEAFTSSIESNGEKFTVPLTLGGMLNFRIGARFSLGTGLVYTLMHSSLEYGENDIAQTRKIKRDYIGVPISFGVDLYRKKKFGLFANSGLQYDFGLNLKTTSIALVDGQRKKTITTKSIGDQASVFLGVGADYQILPKAFLYFQANGNYYFYTTHYNQFALSPLRPALQFGLRLHLN